MREGAMRLYPTRKVVEFWMRCRQSTKISFCGSIDAHSGTLGHIG
ncbi:hypothetical protein LINPERPRIM_LOCUS35139 [Linum perenne]